MLEKYPLSTHWQSQFLWKERIATQRTISLEYICSHCCMLSLRGYLNSIICPFLENSWNKHWVLQIFHEIYHKHKTHGISYKIQPYTVHVNKTIIDGPIYTINFSSISHTKDICRIENQLFFTFVSPAGSLHNSERPFAASSLNDWEETVQKLVNIWNKKSSLLIEINSQLTISCYNLNTKSRLSNENKKRDQAKEGGGGSVVCSLLSNQPGTIP